MHKDNVRFKLSHGRPPCRVYLDVVLTLDGMVLIATGGDNPHIGAVAASFKCDKGEGTIDYTYARPQHKDQIIAELLSQNINRDTGIAAFALAGVHVEDITKTQIEDVIRSCEVLAKRVVERIRCNHHDYLGDSQ